MTDEYPAFEKAIRDIMERRACALVTRDLAELALLLADDFSYVNSQGALWGKTEYLTAVERGALRWSAQTAEEVSVRSYGELAVVTCVVRDEGTWHGEPFSARFRSTQVYALREGAWRYIAGQSTGLEQG
ncbi:nuclear transport factor 2 family protein [Sorangium sp. So ce726]|uniref:nuclear transport factor 2 family protein n=1 Tax=Sorangium sp. So ce726 TaxID=3133319 RepID=UPI003F5EC7F1